MENIVWHIPDVNILDDECHNSKADSLKRNARAGVFLRCGTLKHKELLETELSLVCENKSAVDYMFFIADLISRLRNQNIIVGPGDGTSSSSILCYALGITLIDPLKYGLTPESIYSNYKALPNINIYVAADYEDEVYYYLEEWYGYHFARVMRDGELLPKAAFSSNDLSTSKYASMEYLCEDDEEPMLVLNEKDGFKDEGIITINIPCFDSLNNLLNDDFKSIPLDDSETFAAFTNSSLVGIHTFQHPMFSKYVPMIKKLDFEILTVLNAMFRPGLMEFIPDYLERVNNEKIDCECKYAIDILRETNGMLIYKEQCMQLVNKMTSIPLSSLTSISTMFLPKNANRIQSFQTVFFARGKEKGYTDDQLQEVWDLLKRWALVCYPKAWAVPNTLIAYCQMYKRRLKL